MRPPADGWREAICVNQTNLIDDLTLVPLPVWWQNPWVWVAALLAFAALGWWLVRWWRRPQPAVLPAYTGTYPPMPSAEALRRLQALKARLPEIKDYDLAIEASDILRAFIEGQHQLPIRYQTTREFLEAAAGSTLISAAQRATLGQFLGFCDLGKFARQPATLAEMSETVDTAIRFVKNAAAVAVAVPGGVA